MENRRGIEATTQKVDLEELWQFRRPASGPDATVRFVLAIACGLTHLASKKRRMHFFRIEIGACSVSVILEQACIATLLRFAIKSRKVSSREQP